MATLGEEMNKEEVSLKKRLRMNILREDRREKNGKPRVGLNGRPKKSQLLVEELETISEVTVVPLDFEGSNLIDDYHHGHGNFLFH